MCLHAVDVSSKLVPNAPSFLTMLTKFEEIGIGGQRRKKRERWKRNRRGYVDVVVGVHLDFVSHLFHYYFSQIFFCYFL